MLSDSLQGHKRGVLPGAEVGPMQLLVVCCCDAQERRKSRSESGSSQPCVTLAGGGQSTVLFVRARCPGDVASYHPGVIVQFSAPKALMALHVRNFRLDMFALIEKRENKHVKQEPLRAQVTWNTTAART